MKTTIDVVSNIAPTGAAAAEQKDGVERGGGDSGSLIHNHMANGSYTNYAPGHKLIGMHHR